MNRIPKNNALTLVQCMGILFILLFLPTVSIPANPHSLTPVEAKKEAPPIAEANLSVEKKIRAKVYKKRAISTIKTTHIERIYRVKRKIRHALPPDYRKFGRASWYGRDFHGRKTANGEIFNMNAMTAAHKTLPMNTILLVKNLDTGKNTVVRVNDRGPFVHSRIIDLSYAAAKEVGMVRHGIANVTIEIIPHVNYIAKQKVKETISPITPTTSVLPTTTFKTPLEENTSYSITAKQEIQKQQFEKEKGEFYAQVAAFHDKGRAIELKKRFVEAGHRIVISSQRIGEEDETYRVLVFVGNQLEHAEKFEETLLAKGYNNAFLLPN